MFGWFGDFYRRHRKKFIGLGVATGGAYVSYKVLKWKLSEWREREIEEYKMQAKKQFHYESNQKTCIDTFMHLMVPIRNKIFESLKIEDITDALSNNPENKLDLWEELKLLGFTRTMVSVIGTCTLYVFLQVQMNIIGGYMFLENSELSGDTTEISEVVRTMEMEEPISNLQKEYLNNVRYFFEEGIWKMIDDMRFIINDIAGPISLKSRLSHYELSQMILNIWDQFKLNYLAEKMSKGASTAQCGFSKYLLDGSQCRKRSKYFDEQKYQQVMLETFDVIESEDFQTVLENGIRDSLEHLLRSIEPHFQKNDLIQPDPNTDAPRSEMKIPLAKLLPIINAQSNQIFKAGRNDFLHTLLSVECISSFSANIYESFSLEKD